MDLVDRENGSEMTVDLEEQTITAPGGELLAFPFDPSARHRLLNGLDDIGLALVHEDDDHGVRVAHHAARVDTLAL